ncbi:MAG: GH116 family glycosyl-hydrolase [Clostridiaceae bacterium]|nr:GH116 family glycosyl-hydrolase [Clostridiaceae bacterium]
MSRFTFKGSALKEISFPLGGIGTGSIGLSGSGRFIDWEIYNRPNKRSFNGFTHFAVKVEEQGQVLDARVMNSDLPPSYMGDIEPGKFNGYGFGPSRYTLGGVPHFKDAEFDGRYPQATIRFLDDTFPGQISLRAWNPFIPLNDKDSSLPLAIFEATATNTAAGRRDFIFAFSVNNPLKLGKRYNEYQHDGPLHLIRLLSTAQEPDNPDSGDLTMSVLADRVSCQQNWFRGSWFDNLSIFWQDFIKAGDFVNRIYRPDDLPDDDKSESVATLAARVSLKGGETKVVRFALAWSFPNAWNYWNPLKEKDNCSADSSGSCCCGAAEAFSQPVWKNYYATLFRDSTETIRYLYANLERLARETNRFMTILYRSSLPETALEALTANLSLLRSPTCLRLTDGSFYGFEGCHCQEGCCEGSCTHVWNYAYALPYLFPKLERSMRDLDYRYNINENGAMSFRLQLPPGRVRSAFRPCADGQFGGVIKVYREWLLCGDSEWLRGIWPQVKRSLEYAWSPENKDLWDPEQKGYLSGRQHHTLDMELFGPNSWLSGFYLAALEAGARMAAALGDTDSAAHYRACLERGKTWVDQHLFNGEYFHQQIDLTDDHVLDPYADPGMLSGDVRSAYWNDEAGELKYQIGEGCAIDQVLAQWHCDLIGLGDIFDRAKVRRALASIYRYNYHDSMRQVFNPCRLYCLNDEAGTAICSWPNGVRKPVVPVPYSEETMHGFEYQAGSHMIMNGLETEGLAVVQAVRDRYNGTARNPWNEIECGSNYARSMASYALLLAYSGFSCDLVHNRIGFHPLHDDAGSRFFWSADPAWGEIVFDKSQITFELAGGEIKLGCFSLPQAAMIRQIVLNRQPAAFSCLDGELILAHDLDLKAGDRLCFIRQA